jgi:hypothetical protein
LPEGSAAALICLGDMPLVTGRMLDRIIASYDPDEGRSIVTPVHWAQPGNPMLWDRRYFSEMATLTGDGGARGLLARHAEQVAEVEIGDEAVLRDFDDVESLAGLPEGLRAEGGIALPDWLAPGAALHPQRAAIDVEQGFLLLDLGRLLLADADELADHLHVETRTFCLGVDVLDVAAQRLTLLLQPLDALDQAAQPVGGDAAGLGRLGGDAAGFGRVRAGGIGGDVVHALSP